MSVFDAADSLPVSTINPSSNARAEGTSSALVIYTGSLSSNSNIDAELIPSTCGDDGSNDFSDLVSSTSEVNLASNMSENIHFITPDQVDCIASQHVNPSTFDTIETSTSRDSLRTISTAGTSTQTNIIFFPGEIRNAIYEYLLADIPLQFHVKEDRLKLIDWRTKRTHTSQQPYLQRLCLLPFVSTQAFVECTSIFLLRSIFFIASLDDIFHLETFLLMMPNVHSFDLVREILLVDYGTQALTRSRANVILSFCAQFPNLNRLHIHIGAQSFLEPTSYYIVNDIIYCDPEPRLRALSQVVYDLELSKVARMPLKAVTIVIDHNGLWGHVPRTVAVDIGPWLANAILDQQNSVKYVKTTHFVDRSRQVAKFELELVWE